MLRSNEKLQKFILEFRPLDLDLLHKHFRKFGLNYQLNVSPSIPIQKLHILIINIYYY